jgi:hypothetical protein
MWKALELKKRCSAKSEAACRKRSYVRRQANKPKMQGDLTMTHDPYQAHQLNPFSSPYAGAVQQFMQPGYAGINPLQAQFAGLGQNPWLQNPLQQNPLQQNLLQQNPFQQVQQNPFQQNPLQQNSLLQNPVLQNALLQNPLINAALQNPYIAAVVQNPQLNPILAQQIATLAYSQYAQQLQQPHQFANPFAVSQYGQPQFGQSQFGQSQFGQPQFGQPQFGQPQLAPQSWVGQGMGQQINPLLLQAVARTIPNQGINPWAAF